MSKRVKIKLDPKDLSQPGIAKRTRNLIPGGVAGLPENVRDMIKEISNQQDMAEKYAPAILASLVNMALYEQNPTVRASTAMYLSDMCFGKAIQPLLVSGEIKHTLGLIVVPAINLTNDIVEIDDAEVIEDDKDIK